LDDNEIDKKDVKVKELILPNVQGFLTSFINLMDKVSLDNDQDINDVRMSLISQSLKLADVIENIKTIKLENLVKGL
jgi:hypothetical protein